MRSLFVAGLALAVVGCTSFYPEDPWFDAAALEIDSLSVSEVFEAQQDLLIVATGSNIAPGAVMRIVVDGEVVAASERTTVDSAGQMIAAVFDLPVLEDLPEGDEIEILVEVVQLADGTSSEASMRLRLGGLDELVGPAVTLDEPPRPLYSEISFGTLVFALDEPLMLRATSRIVVGSMGGSAGGCGPGDGDPLCEVANGADEDSVGIGGGGGTLSTDMLVPFLTTRSGAGGRGGAGALGASGGLGGSGGFIAGLDAPEISFTGAIYANSGTQGLPGTCGGGDDSGPGGGGGGGGYWIRATRSLARTQGRGLFAAPGGKGGVHCADALFQVSEGAGGLVRVDAREPGELLSDVEAALLVNCGGLEIVAQLGCLFKRNLQSTQVRRGPLFLPTVRVFRQLPIGLELVPSDSAPLAFWVDGSVAGVLPPQSGRIEIEVNDLSPGAHEVCAYLGEDVDRTLPEAGHCIQIAYLP